MCSIWRGQLKFLAYIVRKEGLENLRFTGQIHGKRPEKHNTKTTWQSLIMAEQGLEAMTKTRKSFRVKNDKKMLGGQDRQRPEVTQNIEYMNWNSNILKIRLRQA